MREYVDAFRAHGLYPCLYYSIWDNTYGIGNGSITEHDMEVIEGQITEILTNYGDIKMLFIDGWSWKMGHVKVPYNTIRALVKKLQPGCLLVDNTHLQCSYDNDMIHFESGALCPADNTLPAMQSALIYKNSGNSWFWDSRIPTAELMSVDEIVINNLNYLEPKWCTFILNYPPNTEGKLDSNIVERLSEVGQAWNPDTTRTPLPKQAPFIESPVIPVSASATSGNAGYAIDGINDRRYYTVWKSSTDLPQSITIDLGQTYDNIKVLNYVPKSENVATPDTQGSIKSYKIYVSTDSITFSEVASGEWVGDAKMKVVTFPPAQARYLKIEALSANNNFAAATEFEIGTETSTTGIENRQGNSLPENFKLEQNYPNPFNPTTNIKYSIPQSGFVTLKVYNMLGQEVATLVNQQQKVGEYNVDFDASNLASGLYVYSLKSGDYSLTKKMILLK